MCRCRSAMMNPTDVLRVAMANLMAVIVGAACSPPRATIDLGRLVVEHLEDVQMVGWSADDGTLYWMGPNSAGNYALQALDVQTGAINSVIQGHDDVQSTKLVAGDSLLFFTTAGIDPESGDVLYRAPFAERRAGSAVPIATGVSERAEYDVSLDGTRVATVDYKTGELSTLDLATGTRQTFGQSSSARFSPDGTRLLYWGPTGALLADPTTGISQPIQVSGDIIGWDGGTPARVVQSNPYRVVDLVTGETRPLPQEVGMIRAYSGDPADLTAAYYEGGSCLYETVADDGVTECGETQNLLNRVNLSTGKSDVVAAWGGRNAFSFSVSQDGQRLALVYDDGLGPSLFVKTLTPP